MKKCLSQDISGFFDEGESQNFKFCDAIIDITSQ